MSEMPPVGAAMLRPGMRYTIWEPARTFTVPGKGEFPQRFASGAFDRTIGKIVPFTHEGRVLAYVKIIAADVAADGSGVSLTYEVQR